MMGARRDEETPSRLRPAGPRPRRPTCAKLGARSQEADAAGERRARLARGRVADAAAYWNGQGVPQDHVEAHMWFNLAAVQGEEVAARNRDDVAGNMTREQLADAQRRARQWFEGTR